ncbi:hypothetical protein BH11PAT2_BH11PAT2_05540 [soil metagenome]
MYSVAGTLLFRQDRVCGQCNTERYDMYTPTIVPTDPSRAINHSISWEVFLERWKAACGESDTAAYNGVIYSASSTVIISDTEAPMDKIGAELLEQEERWMRFLLEVADDFNSFVVMPTDALWTRQEIAGTALSQVARMLKTATNDSMQKYSNNFIDCLFWFFRPLAGNPTALHHYDVASKLPKSQREELDKFLDTLAVWAWKHHPRGMSEVLYRAEAVTLMAARGTLDRFMGISLRDSWGMFTGRTLEILREAAIHRHGSIRSALKNGMDAAVIYVAAREAYGQT